MTRTQILTYLADQGVLGARACLDGHGSKIRVAEAGDVPDWFVGIVECRRLVSFVSWRAGRRLVEVVGRERTPLEEAVERANQALRDMAPNAIEAAEEAHRLGRYIEEQRKLQQVAARSHRL